MKVSAISAIAALAGSAIANDHWQSVWCKDEGGSSATVTVTQTVTVGSPGTTGAPGTTTVGSAPSAHQTFYVTVGAGGKLVYNPDRIDNAKKDDVIIFNFRKANHTVTQSNFDTPCTYNGGFDTGFNQFNPNDVDGINVSFTVPDDSKPLWFYCKQKNPTSHCQAGMVFGINTKGKMDQFIAMAKASNSTGTAQPSGSGSGSAQPTTTSTGSNAIQTVHVGLDNGATLRFDPPFLTGIKQGSIVHFDFNAKNHTLTESTFEKPCTKLVKDGTIDTNFDHAVANDNIDKPFDFTFPNDSPRYFYCKQANGTPNGHCGKGMVFAINIDQGRFNQFQMNAEATLPKVRGRSAFMG
ncbi:MAG: hypothetical protein Q9227_007386 [Pyrenula ochraceoflavens]